MELHLVSTQHLSTQLGNNLTINGDNACLDELIGLATAADTCISQELIQTNGLIGIEVLLLILNTLLQRVLGIGIILSTLGLETTLLTRLITTLLLIAVATLLARLVASALLIATLLVSTLLTRLVTTLLVRLVSATLLIATLLVTTLLVTTLLTGLIATLLTRLIAALLTGLITTLLTILLTRTRLIAALIIIIITGTIAATLRSSTLQSCTESLRTEAFLVMILIAIVTTLRGIRTWLMNTWTRCATLTITLITTLVA